MECRERVLAALNLEEPDRVPCHTILIDENNCDEILGKPQKSELDVAREIRQNNPDEWHVELSSLVEGFEVGAFSRWVEAAINLGLDAMQVGIIPFYFTNEFDHFNDEKFYIRDIFGRVWEGRDNEGNFNPYYLYGTTDSLEKWERIKQDLEGPLKEKYTKEAKKTFKRINKKYNDKIFVMATNNYVGVFDSAWQGMGIKFYSKMLVKRPKFIKEVHDVIADFNIALDNAYMDAGAEVFIEDGDLAYKTRPMLSPKQFTNVLLPAYKKMTDAIHERKGKHVLHTDGHVTPLLDFVVNCGFDGLHSLEPTAGVDLALVKKKVGDKLCLMGNIDIAHILTYGTKDEVYDAVKYAIKVAGPGGGFIISAANMHPAVKVSNLRWMVEATKKFGKYPLSF